MRLGIFGLDRLPFGDSAVVGAAEAGEVSAADITGDSVSTAGCSDEDVGSLDVQEALGDTGDRGSHCPLASCVTALLPSGSRVARCVVVTIELARSIGNDPDRRLFDLELDWPFPDPGPRRGLVAGLDWLDV